MAALLHDFREPLPMPAAATGLVTALTESAPRVGQLVALASGRAVEATCGTVRRAALVELAGPGTSWAPLSCGLGDPGLLLLPAATVVALADLAMGGAGIVEERAPSTLEQDLVVRRLAPCLRPLAEALAGHGVTELLVGAVSDEPLPRGAGEVLAVPLSLVLPEGAVELVVCLPAKSLLPPEQAPAAPAPAPAAHAALGGVPVTLTVRLPGTRVSAEEMDGIAPGDVLRLDPGSTESLVGLLDDGRGGSIAVLRAGLGRRGARRAVVVHDLSDPTGGPTP